MAKFRALGRVAVGALSFWTAAALAADVGKEVAVPSHLQDGQEFAVSLQDLIRHGRRLFDASWTSEEGAGRPFVKGTGAPLADPTDPLVFPRNFNRLSAPDANACAGCHNAPFGVSGGGGDVVANVFVVGQRFDFLTFDHDGDRTPTKAAFDERGRPVTLDSFADSRATIGMFGSGFIEMLARQMTADLQRIRDSIRPGRSKRLVTKGVEFGVLARRADGTWDTSSVQGLAAPSLASSGADDPPSLLVRPFHQAGVVVSLREFSVNAMQQHHGIQATERVGVGADPDGDGFVDELTRADVTALTIVQATMAIPGRVIPDDPAVRSAIEDGERTFSKIGCDRCHVPRLPLTDGGWVFTEPGPYNSPGTLRAGEVPTLSVDLTSSELPPPRLREKNGVVFVPAFTDLKIHDVTSGPDDPNREACDMLQPAGSEAFFAGNGRFVTRKLWGVANEPPFFHHGKFTTMREAVLAHSGEALAERRAFEALSARERDEVIEFLKSLRVLPPGTTTRTISDDGR
jgi:hypothetical protein